MLLPGKFHRGRYCAFSTDDQYMMGKVGVSEVEGDARLVFPSFPTSFST